MFGRREGQWRGGVRVIGCSPGCLVASLLLSLLLTLIINLAIRAF